MKSRLRIFVDDDGRMTLVDIHGYEVVTSKLSITLPHFDDGGLPIVTAEIPGVMIDRASPNQTIEPTHYVHRNSGGKIFVKEAEYFHSQGGLFKDWGKNWTPVVAESIEAARQRGEEILS